MCLCPVSFSVLPCFRFRTTRTLGFMVDVSWCLGPRGISFGAEYQPKVDTVSGLQSPLLNGLAQDLFDLSTTDKPQTRSLGWSCKIATSRHVWTWLSLKRNIEKHDNMIGSWDLLLSVGSDRHCITWRGNLLEATPSSGKTRIFWRFSRKSSQLTLDRTSPVYASLHHSLLRV